MKTQEIISKLEQAGISYARLNRDWYRGIGNEVGEYITGITVETEEEYFQAAEALGVPEDVAIEKLEAYREDHVPDEICVFPISATSEFHLDEGDDDPTFDDGFDLTDF